MYVKLTLWILVFISVQQVALQEEEYDYEDETYNYPQTLNCSTTESIKGGHVEYSQGGLEGSELTYHCGPGKYPFPVTYRTCGSDGDWSPMRLANGRPAPRATCKDVLCPAQLQLDNGDFWPRDQWFRIGTTQSFFCQHGFTLYGSAKRNCTLTGEWTGTTPVCDNHADDCGDPGTPPGAQRSAGRFNTGEKVTYRCQSGLDLLGSAERACLGSREWSGSAPRCQASYMFDSPSAVAEAMAGSLAGVMDVLSPESKKQGGRKRSFGRTIRVDEGSRINIYILLDTSGSIKKEHFEQARQATIALIEKLNSYDVKLRFHVLSFATEAIDIVDIREKDISSSANDVIAHLWDFDYTSHGQKSGTNLHAALSRVNEMISFLKHSAPKHFNETQNVLIIETDGYSNTGPKPQNALVRIRHTLGYDSNPPDNTDETLLDVYVFGVGEKVNKEELNNLASHKSKETHLFILKDYVTLGNVFNSIINVTSVTMCGIAQEANSNDEHEPAYTQPWHVSLSKGNLREPCSGSIVSPNWVLTAAHCFARAATDEVSHQVDINIGGQHRDIMKSSRVILHPKYNTAALKHRNVSEFYDYDVALVHLNKSIKVSQAARPICLPCTIPASRAMKKVNATCQEHRKELMPHIETRAFFIRRQKQRNTREETHIHTESGRRACVEDARQSLTKPTDVTLEEYVPDRFLCSGGSTNYQDATTCKGESGGSLFLQKTKRYFQVGVVSWGIIDVCKLGRGRRPPGARDFHIDLFKILPWLKQHLGKDIEFLPDVN